MYNMYNVSKIPNVIYEIIRLYITQLNRKIRLEFYKEN